MNLIYALAIACSNVGAATDHPAAATDGHPVPPPLPLEGKKRLDPPSPRGRVRPNAGKVLPKPPVQPPTPDPNAIDRVQ